MACIICGFCGELVIGVNWVLVGEMQKLTPCCEECYIAGNKRTRLGFWQRRKRPEFLAAKLQRKDGSPIFAKYSPDYIVLGSVIGTVDDSIALYVLSHEFIHRMFFRDYGAYTSGQFDIILQRRPKWLGGKTLEVHLIEIIRENNGIKVPVSTTTKWLESFKKFGEEP